MYRNTYYNPYQNYNYTNGIFKKFSLTKFLSGTGKTLNVINQAIPIYYQVKPMINNAKTMFKVMSAVKSDDKEVIIKDNKSNDSIKINNENPIFFI